MDIVHLLYGIPVLGWLFQVAGYLIAVIPTSAPIIMRSVPPLALGALCGVMCERSGVVNIGIEGTMLAAAFTGWVVGIAAAAVFGQGTPLLFGFTLPLAIALAAAIVVAVLVSLLHAWLSITVKADQIISGTIINIAALGVTGYLNTIIAATSPTSAGSFTTLTLPKDVTNLPFVGWIFAALFNQGPITLSVLVCVIGLQIWLFRSRWGLRTRAVGEHPKAAETVGIDVIALRYRNVVMAGVFAGLGGAYLSMEAGNSFQANMTAGRGFIALAAMILGRWTPIGAWASALLFALFLTLGQTIKFVPPTGDISVLLTGVPGQFYDALPYLVTIVVLAGVVGRSIPPAADGQPYTREAAT
ncbi:MAG TPA: ABC transporter permease [Candidatus Limnocylindrales bacterium]|nr:ABC transporter permease [Candidatus Limnocylindrales bacterium]